MPVVRLLVVEDDPDIAMMLRRAIERHGHEVTIAGSGADALRAVQTGSPEFVLLDLTLPDMDGRDVLREIRRLSDVPVIVVSARADETARIAALEIGADDYIVKPFNTEELLARVRSVSRRSRADAERPQRLTHKDLRIDVGSRRVWKGDDPVALTNREFEVLRVLLEQHPSVSTRDDIALAVWGRNAANAAANLDVCISGIRTKIGDDPAKPLYIETVRGVGFRMTQERPPAR
jgi:DNA-binding response OmpR family regulator